jgi:hypothetical protein
MENPFSECVEVGDGSWISGFFMAVFGFLFLAWPAMVWDNGFVNFLLLLGLLAIYFAPIFQCDANIAEHAEIKSKASESYDSLLRKYEIKHPNKLAVIWINWLLGTTVIGWFVALYMAHSKKTIHLPAGFVRELNELYRRTFSSNINTTEDAHPNAPQLQMAADCSTPITAQNTVQLNTAPPTIVRKNAICRSCGAHNSILVTRDSHHACEFCGGALEVKTA